MSGAPNKLSLLKKVTTQTFVGNTVIGNRNSLLRYYEDVGFIPTQAIRNGDRFYQKLCSRPATFSIAGRRSTTQMRLKTSVLGAKNCTSCVLASSGDIDDKRISKLHNFLTTAMLRLFIYRYHYYQKDVDTITPTRAVEIIETTDMTPYIKSAENPTLKGAIQYYIEQNKTLYDSYKSAWDFLFDDSRAPFKRIRNLKAAAAKDTGAGAGAGAEKKVTKKIPPPGRKKKSVPAACILPTTGITSALRNTVTSSAGAKKRPESKKMSALQKATKTIIKDGKIVFSDFHDKLGRVIRLEYREGEPMNAFLAVGAIARRARLILHEVDDGLAYVDDINSAELLRQLLMNSAESYLATNPAASVQDIIKHVATYARFTEKAQKRIDTFLQEIEASALTTSYHSVDEGVGAAIKKARTEPAGAGAGIASAELPLFAAFDPSSIPPPPTVCPGVLDDRGMALPPLASTHPAWTWSSEHTAVVETPTAPDVMPKAATPFATSLSSEVEIAAAAGLLAFATME